DATCLTKLQRGLGVLVDKGGFHRRLVGSEFVQYPHQSVMNREKTRRKIVALVCGHRPAAEKAQSIAGALDHTPAGTAKPGIAADNANRSRHATITIARHHCTIATAAGHRQVASSRGAERFARLTIGVKQGAGDRTKSKTACPEIPAAAVGRG